MDKLANMKAFVEVAENQSFAAAARKLNLATSVISKRVKDLEDYLGAQLFIRTTRHVSLTDMGQGYYDYAVGVLSEMAEVEAQIKDNTQRPVGVIKLAAPLSFGMQYLGPALSDYLAKYPDVSIKTYLSDKRIDLIEEGIDLAIRTGPMEDSSLIAKKISDCRRVVCASYEYFETNGIPNVPEDLKDHNCLSYLNLAGGKSWPFVVKGKKTWQAVKGNFLSDNGDLLHQAALSGCGVAFLPTFIVGQSVKQGQLKVVLEDFEETDFSIYAVYQENRHMSAKVRTLIDHLSETLSY